ncbi:MAG: hypothetical protein ACPGN4_00805 [Miltoncostaeaceae bacterium]
MGTDPLIRDTPGIGDGPDVRLLLAALTAEREGQRLLLEGRGDRARPYLAAASEAYLASYPLAQPRSWGRLIGAVKAGVLAGEGAPQARQAREELAGVTDTPASCYLGALCAVILGDREAAFVLAPGMRAGGDAFARAADGIEAIARGDAPALDAAIQAIEADFAAREAHLTGVPIADTALMLQTIGAIANVR